MQTSEALRRTIAVTEELHSVVKTMKALAGVNIRQYERAAHAVAEYNHSIEMALQVALKRLPEPERRRRELSQSKLGAIVFGSDQGMCGQLNDQVVSHASRALSKLAFHHKEQRTIAVGTRAASQLESVGRTVESSVVVPSSTAGIGPAVEEVLRKIEEWHFSGDVQYVILFYAHPVSGAWYRVRGVQMLPVDEEWIASLKARPWPSKVIPTSTIEEAKLFQLLIREYLFVCLFRAFAESLTSENASRLASMQVAERNIEDRLKALTTESRQLRQMTITSELLDIISAYEALRGNRKS